MSEHPRGPEERDSRRQRRQTVALALTVVLGTALLLWGSDWLARRGAESVLARVVQERTGVLDRPDVQVHGALFLPQVLRGRYDQVEVAAEGLSSGPLRVERLSADLSGVYLSFHDLLHGTPDRVVIARSVEEALLTYEDLNRFLGFTGRPLTLEPAPGGQVRVSGTVDVLGESLAVATVARIEADDDALVLRPTLLDTAEPLTGVRELLVTQRFSFRVPLDPLAFGQRITDIEVVQSGLVIRATGSRIVLGP
jgi:hypothetical protein